MITCWIPISPADGKYLASPGGRYAALANVDAHASLADISGALKNQSFDVTYAWQSGQPSRAQFFIDRWLAGLPVPAQGKTWMYFEMNFSGDMAKTLAAHIEKCVLWVCGSADIVNVFESQQVADNYHPCGPGDPQGGDPVPPPSPGCPVPPSPLGPVMIGAAAGAALTAILVLVVD